MTTLADQLWNQGRPVGYVSFLTALVHHGLIVDGVASVQVASLDRTGTRDAGTMFVDYYILPRDLWFGFEAQTFEGERVPVATPEKALLDWCWLAEERGSDPRLDEVEWSALDIIELDRLAAEMGLDYRRQLPPEGESHHDQDRMRAEALARLR